jgi:amidohydrolase
VTSTFEPGTVEHRAKSVVAERLGVIQPEVISISHWLHGHPELAFEEYRAADLLAGTLDAHGFDVEHGLCDLPTAFRAQIGTGRLRIALCAEYDALPGIGHACGHNMIAAISLAAAIALAPLADDLDCTVVVLGTPAEEHGSGKVLLLQRGGFDDVGAVMMVHPGPFDVARPATLAMSELSVRATGKEAHAGATPHLGVSAADALVVAQTAIGLLRQHLPPGDVVHGIVTAAGTAANLVPGSASAEYVVRAPDAARRDALALRVRRCFEAGGLATGADVTVEPAAPALDALFSNQVLLNAYRANLAHTGRRVGPAPPVPIATDLGNVSQVIPAIHPLIGIGCWPTVNHQAAFAPATVTNHADVAIGDAAVALARTVIDVACRSEPRQALLSHGGALSPSGSIQ